MHLGAMARLAEIAAVLGAMCVPAEFRTGLFPGARELLVSIKSLAADGAPSCRSLAGLADGARDARAPHA